MSSSDQDLNQLSASQTAFLPHDMAWGTPLACCINIFSDQQQFFKTQLPCYLFNERDQFWEQMINFGSNTLGVGNFGGFGTKLSSAAPIASPGNAQKMHYAPPPVQYLPFLKASRSNKTQQLARG